MSISWSGDLEKNLALLDARIRRAMVTAAHYVAPQAEEFMKNNASWTDQTGNARNGLKAVVETGGVDTVAIVLFHSVPYGVFLEVRWGGRYAIIEPALQAYAPVYAQAVGRLAFGKV